jgi:hypothetical protein
MLLEEADRPAGHEHRRIVFTPELIIRASSQPDGPMLAAPDARPGTVGGC